MAANQMPFSSFKTFAEYLATDDELLIFRRFCTLNARSLLHYQSELLSLERELDILDQEDINDGSMEVMLSAKCWEIFSSKANEHAREFTRSEVIRKIQEATYKYNQALLQQHDMLKLRPPETRPMTALQKWFEIARPLVGYGSKLMDDGSDFVSLKPCVERDALTRIVEDLVGWATLRKQHPGNSPGTVYFPERTVQKLSTFVGIVGAVLLLEVAIVLLYFINNNNVRFGIVAIFTMLFATAVSLFSNARRAEMFGACAAYSAVLVVFLSGNINSGS